ncbi:helix-turn-helix domain-containing protein [Aureliella helgolandensis]|uniref:Helix-turn-helix domain protein n=1 Tax=Aureliella helgolandensis TaxID=2527968 RepID=A0A518GDN6_9BACT|nr:helix-turn-helix domain-containing protein [Aureliella helgolandensis]QDV26660.1 Helix-turn-helix domain protein [Aureliella helgolandensis]
MRKLLSTRDVANLTGFSIQKIRQLIRRGQLPAVNTSTGTRERYSIQQRDLDQFLTPKKKRESAHAGV